MPQTHSYNMKNDGKTESIHSNNTNKKLYVMNMSVLRFMTRLPHRNYFYPRAKVCGTLGYKP